MRKLTGLLLIFAWLMAGVISAVPQPRTQFGEPQISAVKRRLKTLNDAKVVDFGRVVYRGNLNVNPTIARIRDGKKLSHRNDGSIHGNREKRLPVRTDRQYYREFVFEVRGVKLPGPARLIVGKGGEVYFTGDHYATFREVKPE